MDDGIIYINLLQSIKQKRPKKLLEPGREFSKDTRQKVNLQKLIVFLNASDDENRHLKTTFTII